MPAENTAIAPVHPAPAPAPDIPGHDPRLGRRPAGRPDRSALRPHRRRHLPPPHPAPRLRRGGPLAGLTAPVAHWLSWRTGISLGPAREKVRVARPPPLPAPHLGRLRKGRALVLEGEGPDPRRHRRQRGRTPHLRPPRHHRPCRAPSPRVAPAGPDRRLRGRPGRPERTRPNTEASRCTSPRTETTRSAASSLAEVGALTAQGPRSDR